MSLTTPRRTTEHHRTLPYLLQPLRNLREGISANPEDLLRNAVDLGVMLGAREDDWVLLDGEDLLPTA